jgi:glycosyltransferase involved in cell wall biosynthesis
VIIGIDASNLRAGGGTTHLIGLLGAADPASHGVSRVVVWGGTETLSRLPSRDWLTAVREPWLDGSAPMRLLWQRARLPRLAAQGCDLLFAPGGLVLGAFHPVVTMSRNILPFDGSELARFGHSPTALRLRVLRWGQSRSFEHADGVIFLTEFARAQVTRVAKLEPNRLSIIPHGVDERFRRAPRPPRPLADCSIDRPFRVLYVSIVSPYKHQWNVAEAVARLRREGLPIALELAGPAEPSALARLERTLSVVDPKAEFIRYSGPAPFSELHEKYGAADLFVFASSAENMPNILLEAMASGLPIASSDRGPMPEVLGDAGVYFDPEKPVEIADAIRRLAQDEPLRERSARLAHQRADAFSWPRCARETFAFIAATSARRIRSPSATSADLRAARP